MNRHFEDSQYYLRRAAATTKRGVLEEIAPIHERVAQWRGDEEEAEPVGRFGRVRRRVSTGVRKGRETGEHLLGRGRERVRQFRGGAAE